MFFEGSEKKFEAVFSGIDLRKMDRSFFAELVGMAKAEILSSISNEHFDAYLLSESSLFVWSDRVLMITCGKTTLIHALLFLVDKVGEQNLESLIFQRKNEFYSHLQHTTFEEDINILRQSLDGTCIRFGHEHEHHNSLFHCNKPYQPHDEDKTFELLMYDICEEASDFLTESGNTAETVRAFFKLDKILPGFEVDDFVFEPFGYSMNAMKGDKYCTVHVTPQRDYSYVSFETNLAMHGNFMTEILDVLKPESFDIVAFEQEISDLETKDYKSRIIVSEKIDCGYRVDFAHFYRDDSTKKAGRRF